MYQSIPLVPADGSILGSKTPRYADMVSLDGKVTIKFVDKVCYLRTPKGRYILEESYIGTVAYAHIGKYYVCFNGAKLSWKLMK